MAKTAGCIRILPLSIKRIQPIGVLVFLRGGVVERCKLKSKDRLVIGKGDGCRDIDGLPGRRVLAADLYRLIEQIKIREHHWWRVGIVDKLVWIKALSPFTPPKNSPPSGVLVLQRGEKSLPWRPSNTS